MKYLKTGEVYVISLSKGEKIIEKLYEFCEKEGIISGFLNGFGAACDIELGYYNLETKEYSWKKFSDVCEILSLNGNISLVDGNPFIHAHISISNNNFQAFGGHLKEATVGGACEIVINPLDVRLSRKFDDETGLKLLDLSEE